MFRVALFVLLILCACNKNNADSQFRGGYITYRIDNENDSTYDITVTFASSWKVGPTACIGDTTQTNPQATTVRIQSLIQASPLQTSPSSLVQCSSTNSDLTVRSGSSTWTVSNLQKNDFYFLIYNIDSAWQLFPCCPQMTGISTGGSIALQTSLPLGTLNTRDSLNSPPQFSELLIIEIKAGETKSYTIPASDPESNEIRCRLPNTAEAGALALITSPQATITAGCTFTIDATSKTVGEYPMAFMVEDFISTSVSALHSIPYQIVYYVTSSSTTNAIDATVTCTQNNMRIEIPVSEFAVGTAPAIERVKFSGRIETECASQILGSNYVLTSSLNQCGTAFESQDATHINYVNTVVIGSAVVGTITRSFTGVQIKVRCKYRSDYSSENDKSYIANSLVSSEEENFGSFTIALRAFDSTYANAITLFPMSVDLSTRQYCQIDVTDNNDDTVVIAERVFASTSSSRATGQTHNLIVDRCPNQFDSTVQLNNAESSRSQFRFSFEAFVFSSNTAEQVYVHCDTFLCHQDSVNARCNTACPGFTGKNANNVGRITALKKRREIGQYLNHTNNIDQPSRIYFLVAGPYVLAKEDSYEREIPSGSVQTSDDRTDVFSRTITIAVAAAVVALVAIGAIIYVTYHRKQMMKTIALASA